MPLLRSIIRDEILYDTLINTRMGYATADIKRCGKHGVSTEGHPSIQKFNRLFAGQNLGLYWWTNAHAPGTIPGKKIFWVRRIGVDVRFLSRPATASAELRELFLAHARLAFYVGDMPQFVSPVYNLLGEEVVVLEGEQPAEAGGLRRAAPPIFDNPKDIPPRQSFYVDILIDGPHAEDVIHDLNRQWDCWRFVQVSLWGTYKHWDEPWGDCDACGKNRKEA